MRIIVRLFNVYLFHNRKLYKRFSKSRLIICLGITTVNTLFCLVYLTSFSAIFINSFKLVLISFMFTSLIYIIVKHLFIALYILVLYSNNNDNAISKIKKAV